MSTFLASIPFYIYMCVCLILQEEVAAQFLTPNCGLSYEPNMATRIVHGKEALLKSAPFMAYLYNNSKLHCGGTIISNRYILTAAHCMRTYLKVRLGEHDVTRNPDCQGISCSPPVEEFDIVLATKYKGFDGSLANDIALLKLSRLIRFNAHIQPICLILNPAAAPNVQELQAFGWGYNEMGQSANVLQTTFLVRYALNYCRLMLERPITVNQLCVGLKGSDTCSGDSGGPLVTKVNYDGVWRYLQLGIVSYGDAFCQSPGVYTYVPHYIRWIQNVMQTNGH
ncbi:serine protease grass [Drosophila erecta]|uniref:Peptidase S1 domain-containing protein n=1 Tax=Drosophila erecta TaxID=7220 RepID=B3NQA0_DROER|nr:serine protease grass [Drosophila erecta]EDV55876.1 uncharacterized protein Dere_GG20542 [Drosophila erecta]